MFNRIILVVLLTCIQYSTTAQKDVDSLNFTTVDSFVRTVKYQSDIYKLSKDLTSPFPDYIFKFRAIFKWMTDNIRYDYEFINKEKELTKPDCYEYLDCAPVMKKWENNFIRGILRNKKATSEGYATVFKKLCELSSLSAEVIFGYLKTKPYQVGNNMSANHYWNAVLIYGEWYYLDATLAAGECIENEETGMLVRFVRKYKNYYWAMDFNKLVRNRYPKDANWIEDATWNKARFFNLPFYYTTKAIENISVLTPQTGVLKAKKGDVIHFKFTYNGSINKLQINSNIFRNLPLWYEEKISKRKTRKVRDTWAEKKQQYIPFTKNGNVYEFDYTVTDKSLYYLELVFDYEKMMRYRVRVEE